MGERERELPGPMYLGRHSLSHSAQSRDKKKKKKIGGNDVSFWKADRAALERKSGCREKPSQTIDVASRAGVIFSFMGLQDLFSHTFPSHACASFL